MNHKARAQKEAQRLEEKYGNKTGTIGSTEYKLNVVPTGALALDYALGIGGWPRGHPVLVYGLEDIGKSSMVGLSAIREAQRAGLLCGIIAVEPGFDEHWAYKHGVDPETVVIARPNTGEEAFSVLIDWVEDDIVDFIVFDSLGGIVSEVERQEGAKSRVGGQSKLITDGIKRILTPTWKNNKGVIFLNQVRDDMQSRIPGLVQPPGGRAQRHSCAVIVQLKPGKARYMAKIDGEDVMIGQSIVALIQRNKLSEGSKIKALFDFYQREIEGRPFGVDVAADVIATGTRTKVIEKAGSWYRHESFPEGRLLGKQGVAEFIDQHPKVLSTIRSQVIEKMLEERTKKSRPALKAVENG